MKPVRCSWVDMQKIREALSACRRGDQAALTQMRCVDHRTVSDWKAACDILEALSNAGKCQISGTNGVKTFQPSHAVELARHLRRTKGKDPAKWDADEIADWVDKCESEKLTVEQFRAALLAEKHRPAGAPEEECCTTADLNALVTRGKKFGTIYADPPWAYSNQATRAATGNHYKAEESTGRHDLSIEELCALPVRELAADYAHLHLWTTNAFIFECPRIFDAWGFTYQGIFVWCKPQMGIGNCWRVSTEYLLLAIRGEPRKFRDGAHDMMSYALIDRGEHSAKPEQVRKMIERASPGPYLELFARREVKEWSAWGNEIRRDTPGLFDDDEEENKEVA